MKSHNLPLTINLLLLSAMSAMAEIHYVDVNSASPTPPYTNWTTAATTIQAAVDAAVAGDQILVTNGVYSVVGLGTVSVYQPLSLSSLNGPEFTVIDGGSTVGCVYLTSGASLSGFTLTNGFADNGGGVSCESTSAVISNCVLTGNSAFNGGGAYGGTLNNCILTGNSAGYGGGTRQCILNNCTLSGNAAYGDPDNYAGYGGGAFAGTLNNCTLTGNSATYGGGASGRLNVLTLGYWVILNNCVLTGNSAGGAGGGVYLGDLNNCTLSGNSAGSAGGGASGDTDHFGTPQMVTLNNCTLIGNSAGDTGGGASYGSLRNCAVYYNTAPSGANYDSYGTLNYCCTTPLPGSGTGNLSAEPQLADLSHLSANSPCRGAGSAAYATGLDIDGQAWANPPSIGCDEYHVGGAIGPLSVDIQASYTNVTSGFTVYFTAVIGGRASASQWDFGGGIVVSNRSFFPVSWAAVGDYPVVLWAYNETYPNGVSATVTVHVVEAVHYVSLDSTNPAPPYTTWATAATNIQDAVDAASVPEALVLVTNGVYATGGQAVSGTMNRVAVTKLLTVRSVNGPGVTVIRGYQVPGTGAVRCVYLTNGAALDGFTLTNGGALNSLNGGGVWCESTRAVISNCVLIGNSATYGGGAYSGTLNNCTLADNSADEGGGAFDGTLNNCTLTGNSANAGGGAFDGTLNNCTLTGNSASANFFGNGGIGGGALEGRLNNCALTGNSATDDGGGAQSCTLNNCTLIGNSADYGGGAGDCSLRNCVVYYNTAQSGTNYDYNCTLNYCCTTPLPNANGNLTTEPLLASLSHLSANSPCRGAGSTAYATGVDIDGEAWAIPPSIGCDEYHPGAVIGPLSVAIQSSYTNVTPGFAVNFTAVIDGRVSASQWELGDGIVVSNRPYASHSWAVVGDYPVVLWAYNESYPNGASATVIVHVVAQQPVHYVALDSTNPVSPYTSWATAATKIQHAVDAATVPGALVLVTNGMYDTGGRAVFGTMNRVAVTKLLTVRSVNGPEWTVINGAAAIRCVYLTNGTSLSGFTLTNGFASSGGGVQCESTKALVTNCLIAGNSAIFSGGGAFNGTLNNSVLTGNSASLGGGSYSCTLNNCTLTGNSAGGGAYSGTLKNCIVYFNTGWNCAGYSTLNYCCTTPNPDGGGGNFTNAPLFTDQVGGNLRLQSNSPCINAGINAYAPPGPDLDGNPRIVGGTVDIGAYEFQIPTSVISYAWLQQFALPPDGSADFTDPDHDGMNTWQEWRTGTDPTNALSALRLLTPLITQTNVIVAWQSVPGVNYFLERGTNVAGPPPMFTPLATDIPGQSGTTTFTDASANGPGPFFYRVGVQSQ